MSTNINIHIPHGQPARITAKARGEAASIGIDFDRNPGDGVTEITIFANRESLALAIAKAINAAVEADERGLP